MVITHRGVCHVAGVPNISIWRIRAVTPPCIKLLSYTSVSDIGIQMIMSEPGLREPHPRDSKVTQACTKKMAAKEVKASSMLDFSDNGLPRVFLVALSLLCRLGYAVLVVE